MAPTLPLCKNEFQLIWRRCLNLRMEPHCSQGFTLTIFKVNVGRKTLLWHYGATPSLRGFIICHSFELCFLTIKEFWNSRINGLTKLKEILNYAFWTFCVIWYGLINPKIITAHSVFWNRCTREKFLLI